MRRLRNSTGIPDSLVREVEAFVMPPGGVWSYDLELRNSSAPFAGRAYWAGSCYHETARPFIVLRLGRESWPRMPVDGRSGYLPTPALMSRVEGLVYIYAHEIRHLWQARVPRGRRVWGARGQFSERDCDAYAINALRRWRRRLIREAGAE